MTKTKKTVVALLAVFAVGATATVASMSFSKNAHTAFADTSAPAKAVALADETSIAPVGSEENPEVVTVGETITIREMYVIGNPEMGYKELAYYLSFTPTQSGVYNFKHSNPDIGVNEIYSETEAPYGDWNDDWTEYSLELTKDVTYTISLSNFDWMIDLSDYEIGAAYTLDEPATIDISYANAADGSTYQKALTYEVGDTIIVPAGHDAVWYTFTGEAETAYYLISMGGNVSVNYVSRNVVILVKETGVGYTDFSRAGTLYLCVTPTATEPAEVQVLKVADQTEGSCVATAAELPENRIVGDNMWYKYTVGGSNVEVSLVPTDDAPVVDGVKIAGTVYVYDGCTFIDTLYEGKTVTLESGKTYNFFAPKYEYKETDESGEVTVQEVNSVLNIK